MSNNTTRTKRTSCSTMLERIERRAKLSMDRTSKNCLFACGERGPKRKSGCFMSICHFIVSVSRGSLRLRRTRASNCVFTALSRVGTFATRKGFLRCSDVGGTFRVWMGWGSSCQKGSESPSGPVFCGARALGGCTVRDRCLFRSTAYGVVRSLSAPCPFPITLQSTR